MRLIPTVRKLAGKQVAVPMWLLAPVCVGFALLVAGTAYMWDYWQAELAGLAWSQREAQSQSEELKQQSSQDASHFELQALIDRKRDTPDYTFSLDDRKCQLQLVAGLVRYDQVKKAATIVVDDSRGHHVRSLWVVSDGQVTAVDLGSRVKTAYLPSPDSRSMPLARHIGGHTRHFGGQVRLR